MTSVRSNAAVDPFLAFRFVVSWKAPGGAMTPAAYVGKISALTRDTELKGGSGSGASQDIRKIPGQTTYGELTFEQGLTTDPDFEEWASKVLFFSSSNASGAELSSEFRRDLKIDLLDQAGKVITTYLVFSCWPMAYNALPELDASSTRVAIESMTLQHEGWTLYVESDASV